MKLSSETVNILQNFSLVNQALYFTAGNKLKTANVAKTLLVDATIKESFPIDFAIYDLPKFISTYKLLDDPELKFENAYVSMIDANAATKYYYTQEGLIDKQTADLTLANEDVVLEFNMTREMLTTVMTAGKVLKLDYIKWSVEDGIIKLSMVDVRGENNDTYVLNIGEAEDTDIEIYLKAESIRFITGEYVVRIGKLDGAHPVMELMHTEEDVRYLAALDDNSKI